MKPFSPWAARQKPAIEWAAHQKLEKLAINKEGALFEAWDEREINLLTLSRFSINGQKYHLCGARPSLYVFSDDSEWMTEIVVQPGVPASGSGDVTRQQYAENFLGKSRLACWIIKMEETLNNPESQNIARSRITIAKKGDRGKAEQDYDENFKFNMAKLNYVKAKVAENLSLELTLELFKVTAAPGNVVMVYSDFPTLKATLDKYVSTEAKTLVAEYPDPPDFTTAAAPAPTPSVATEFALQLTAAVSASDSKDDDMSPG